MGDNWLEDYWDDFSEWEPPEDWQEEDEMNALGDVNWTLVDNDDRFREQAACRDYPTSLFFLEQYENQYHGKLAAAREICATCPVVDDCLRFALNNHIQFGIWAGTTPLQRKHMRRNTA